MFTSLGLSCPTIWKQTADAGLDKIRNVIYMDRGKPTDAHFSERVQSVCRSVSLRYGGVPLRLHMEAVANANVSEDTNNCFKCFQQFDRG